MVDVAIGAAHAPAPGIRVEISANVLVDTALQIQSLRAERADDDIGADAAILRHITAGIAQADVGRVVVAGHADLGASGRDQRRSGPRGRGRSRRCRECDANGGGRRPRFAAGGQGQAGKQGEDDARVVQ